jgi:hypothetical protein
MVEPSWRLGVYPWSSYYVRWRWDRFSTLVHAIRCVWAPVTRSHRDRHLWPPLPEALGLAKLIRYWKPLGAFDQRPELCPGLRREAGRADRWQNLACLCPLYGEKVKVWIVPELVLFRLVPLLFSLEWCGLIRYGVYGSLAICQ